MFHGSKPKSKNIIHLHFTSFVCCTTICYVIASSLASVFSHSIFTLLFSMSAAQIQRALMRNNQTQRFSQKQAQRLHQGLVTSTAEQVALVLWVFLSAFCLHDAQSTSCLCVSKVMERLCVRVQQQVCALRGVGEMEEIQAAKQVVKEARNSRAVSGCETYEGSNCIADKQKFELCNFSLL